MTASAYLAPSHTPLTLTAKIRSKTASSCSSMRVGNCGTPAFAKKMSSVPHVAQAADNQLLVEKAVATWGTLDIFFANAGVPQFPARIEEQEEAVLDRHVAANAERGGRGARSAT